MAPTQRAAVQDLARTNADPSHAATAGATPMTLSLRPYQQEGLDAIDEALARAGARQVVVQPPGAGKTIMFSTAIAKGGRRSLVLVHRDELVQQTVDKLAVVAPSLDVGVIKAERNEVDAAVLVASVQTVSRETRLQ